MAKSPVIYSTYEFLGILFIWCEQDFHPGTGKGTGIIDLSIQRDEVTGVPICRSSSLKGAIRSSLRPIANQMGLNLDELFGSDIHSPQAYQLRAGAIEFLNAGILLYPIQSYIGLFAYITSPYQIMEYWFSHLRNGYKLAQIKNIVDELSDKVEALEEKLKDKRAIVPKNSIFVVNGKKTDIVLYYGEFVIKSNEYEEDEELSEILNTLASQAIPKIGNTTLAGYSYLENKIKHATILVRNEDFVTMVNRSLPRITRIAINPETKTVKKGALFTQELIPKHTLMATGLYKAIRYTNKQQINMFKEAINLSLINVGGGETVGYGMIRLVINP